MAFHQPCLATCDNQEWATKRAVAKISTLTLCFGLFNRRLKSGFHTETLPKCKNISKEESSWLITKLQCC